jgi:hypothetical protein
MPLVKRGGGSYTLPTASADTLGGVKVGANLSIADGVLSAEAGGGGGGSGVGDKLYLYQRIGGAL